jgi:hypothetical protein
MAMYSLVFSVLLSGTYIPTIGRSFSRRDNPAWYRVAPIRSDTIVHKQKYYIGMRVTRGWNITFRKGYTYLRLKTRTHGSIPRYGAYVSADYTTPVRYGTYEMMQTAAIHLRSTFRERIWAYIIFFNIIIIIISVRVIKRPRQLVIIIISY